jgi:streptogramin lyase
MVFGPLGHLYVTDRLGHTIRRLDAQTGQVTTIAGRDGRPGSADGPGSSARFNQPHGIAVDAQGRLFVVDRYNYTIRMIEWVDNATCFKTNNYTGYCVTTIAGRRGLVGAVNGPGSVAQFHHPVDVALDRQGGLFVADYSNHQIRRISWVTNAPCGAVASHTGVCVTTYVGSRTAGLKDALGGAAQFRGPHGVATDAKGVLYVADYQNHAIRKVDLQGNVTTLVGGVAGYRDGTAAIARLNGPMGLTVDAKGELYVAEYFNDVLRRVSTNGTVSTTTGKVNDTTFRNGLLLDARLHEPTGVAIAPDGRIVIADSNNEVLRVIELSRVRTLAGRPGAYGGDDGDALCAQMRLPIHAVRDHLGNIYVADYENHVIYRITNGRDVELFAGADSRTANHRDGHRLQAWFYAPTGLAVDAAGNVYVADSRNHVIRKIDVRSQMVSTFAGIPKSSGRADNRDKAKATFDEPMALVFGPKGHLYVADMGNDCLRKIDGTTNVVKVWAGKCGSSGDKDGKIGTARLHGPRGLVATPAGELYVADHYNHKVKKVDTTGQLSGVAGSRSGYVDGTGNKAQFSYPWHLLRLPNGNVLVADPNNHRIRHLDVSTGVVTKRAGVRTPGSRDNFALNSSFYRPRGLALFNDLGDVLVVDSLNRTLRVVPGCP